MNAPAVTPTKLRKVGAARFCVSWADGHESDFSAPELRRRCACAACRDEITGRRTLDPTTVPDTLTIQRASVTGRYAVTFEFSDGHGTGIFSFDHLRAICPCCIQP